MASVTAPGWSPGENQKQKIRRKSPVKGAYFDQSSKILITFLIENFALGLEKILIALRVAKFQVKSKNLIFD